MNTVSLLFIENVCDLLPQHAEKECAELIAPWPACANRCRNQFDFSITKFGCNLFYSVSGKAVSLNSPIFTRDFFISTLSIYLDAHTSSIRLPIREENVGKVIEVLRSSRKPPHARFIGGKRTHHLLTRILSRIPLSSVHGELSTEEHTFCIENTVPYSTLTSLITTEVVLSASFLRTLLRLVGMAQFKHLALSVDEKFAENFDVLLTESARSLCRRPGKDAIVVHVDKRKQAIFEEALTSDTQRGNVEFRILKRYNWRKFQMCFHTGRLSVSLCSTCSM